MKSILAAARAVARERLGGIASGPPAYPDPEVDEALVWDDLVAQGLVTRRTVTNAELQAEFSGTRWEDDDPEALDRSRGALSRPLDRRSRPALHRPRAALGGYAAGTGPLQGHLDLRRADPRCGNRAPRSRVRGLRAEHLPRLDRRAAGRLSGRPPRCRSLRHACRRRARGAARGPRADPAHRPPPWLRPGRALDDDRRGGTRTRHVPARDRLGYPDRRACDARAVLPASRCGATAFTLRRGDPQPRARPTGARHLPRHPAARAALRPVPPCRPARLHARAPGDPCRHPRLCRLVGPGAVVHRDAAGRAANNHDRRQLRLPALRSVLAAHLGRCDRRLRALGARAFLRLALPVRRVAGIRPPRGPPAAPAEDGSRRGSGTSA